MMAKDVEHFTKKYLLAIYTSSFAKNVSLVHLSIYWLDRLFFMLNFVSCLYILAINPLSDE